MALRINNPGMRDDYVLEHDRESDHPTVFVLRALTWEEMMEVNELVPLSPEQTAELARIHAKSVVDKRPLNVEELNEIQAITSRDKAYVRKQHRQYRLIVKYGVCEVRGAQDHEGKPLAVSVSDFVKVAPPDVIIEIGLRILMISRFGEGDIKNSDGPPARGRSVTGAANVH